MLILKRIVIGFVILLLIAVATVYIYLQFQKPNYDGDIGLKGLKNEVEVLYDTYGVPHIYASNDEDAYFALGYVHAQDRLFQMEMLRRAADGRLAEILGKDLVSVDKLFRTLGLNKFAEQNAAQFLSGDTAVWQREALAYQNGINTFIENGPTPLEFTIIGIPKTKFEPRDIYLAIGFMSFGFAEGLRVDPILEKINTALGSEYLKDFNIDSPPDAVRIPNFKGEVKLKKIDDLITSIHQTLEQIPIPQWTGSNGWVVSADKSKSASPILANDTHIGFGQPAVWYEAHLEYPGYSFYGHHIAGIPFGLLGNNKHGGWGLTMFENDETDFFIEEINPVNKLEVKFKDEWETIQSRIEVITIKDEEDLLLEVRSTRHGPIVNGIIGDVNDDDALVSLTWMLTQHPNEALEAAYLLNHAQSINDMQKAASLFTSPGLNVMYGDVEGNIAWWAVGKLPIRPSYVQPKLFLNGSSGNDEYTGYYDFSKNPQSINPPWGYVYSSNNQPDSVDGILYPGYYYPKARAKRIISLLEKNEKISAEEMQQLQLDGVSETAQAVAGEIAKVLNALDKSEYRDVATKLSAWDGDHQMNDVAPSLYYNLLSFILYASIPDEIGTTSFKSLLNSSIMKSSYLKLISNDTSRWWDNVNTKDIIETRNMIFDMAADKTIKLLTKHYGNNMEEWTWGKMHTLTHGHPLGAVKPLDKVFNVGPYQVPGGMEVINNLMFTLDTLGSFPSISGPALRKVTDFADLENGFTVSPSGQSGNWLSPHYDDQAALFATGKVRKMMMNESEIKSTSKNKLHLYPE